MPHDGAPFSPLSWISFVLVQKSESSCCSFFRELLQGRAREKGQDSRESELKRDRGSERERERESGWVDGGFVCSALCLGVVHPPFLGRSVLQSRVVVCFIMMTAQAPDAAPSSSAR